MTDGSSSEISQEDDDWQEVYHVSREIMQGHRGVYYQTYGGGPEGGYLVSKDKIYTVNRNWFLPFEVRLLKHQRLHFKNEDGIMFLKITTK